jgi:hypothetical protein
VPPQAIGTVITKPHPQHNQPQHVHTNKHHMTCKSTAHTLSLSAHARTNARTHTQTHTLHEQNINSLSTHTHTQSHAAVRTPQSCSPQ